MKMPRPSYGPNLKCISGASKVAVSANCDSGY